jgi:hypothetical protein
MDLLYFARKALIIGACALPSLLPAAAQTPAAPADKPIERLAWLGGCWRSDGAEFGSGEQWLPLAGGTLLGVNRSVREGVTVSWEFMQIRQQADGNVVFAAQPLGRPETLFILQPGRPLEAVFENLANDFPQRVIYRLDEGGRLRARIEGLRNRVLAGVDFPMQRTPCDGQPPLPEAFQGLPWGAGETQLALRFGPVLKPAECAPAGQRGTLRPREACNHPTLAPYEVAGVPFRLNLHVDERTRQLVRVSLVWAGEGAVASATDNGWSDKHRVLRQLLTQRYGSAESTHVDSDMGNHTATARWRRGDTLIELRSSFQPRGTGNAAREQVDIVYLPITAGDAGKL